ncbi:hypothetical protein BC826DRAFT_908451 [Russula brevipes]|nr:hypothetical protein BC826DRAFT_908451 [Russula brevipes]
MFDRFGFGLRCISTISPAYSNVSLTLLILLLSSLVSVLACEGDCIKGITYAWLGNYTTPVHTVFQHLAGRISEDLFPAGSDHDSMSYLHPIMSVYEDSSYDGMRTAIFPSYFHGKCQRNGVDPSGCPNPDCPVVCGTPGSLVHFFPTLRFIAFNHTRRALRRLCSPGNDAYDRAERTVVQAAAGYRGRGRELRRSMTQGRYSSYVRKRQQTVKKRFEAIMRQTAGLLEKACGGHPSEDEDALPKCSWEEDMKTYILTFP